MQAPSVLSTVHQNNIVSTIRNLEVAADTTNILALECALRRKDQYKKDRKTAGKVKLCSSQRLTRGQSFKGKYFSAHFNVLSLCTAGKDEGNDKFEAKCLSEHIKERLLTSGIGTDYLLRTIKNKSQCQYVDTGKFGTFNAIL